MPPPSDPARLRRRAILSLAVWIPAPSLGVLFGMIWFPGQTLGIAAFLLCKIWFFGLPAAWRLLVEREPLSLSPARRGGWGLGIGSGLLLGAIVFLLGAGPGGALIDPAFFRERLTAAGLGSPAAYLAGAAYWILVNSVLEEYAWRWFCYRQFETLLRPGVAAAASAAAFALHHFLALQVYLPLPAAAIGTLGVGLGGWVWSLLYGRTRSIWPGYVSHALADVAVFWLGARILFGG